MKIGDLNVSKLMKHGMVKTQIGTPYYMSPEIWRNKPYDYKVHACACCMRVSVVVYACVRTE